MLGNWSESIECELREIRAQSEHRKQHFSIEEVQGYEIDDLFSLLNVIFAHKNETRKAKLVMQVRTPFRQDLKDIQLQRIAPQVLWYWNERGLNVTALESFLIKNMVRLINTSCSTTSN